MTLPRSEEQVVKISDLLLQGSIVSQAIVNLALIKWEFVARLLLIGFDHGRHQSRPDLGKLKVIGGNLTRVFLA